MTEEINSLKITQNPDGSYTMDWDRKDPMWSWLNSLTNEQVQIIVQQAIQDRLNQNDA
jgi:hypothetical protein